MLNLLQKPKFLLPLLLLQLLGPLNISITASSEPSKLSVTFGSPALAGPTYSFKGNRRNRPSSDGSGSRGCEKTSSIALTLLVPNDHDGRTTADHPTLFWYMPERKEVSIALAERGVAEPILKQKIKLKDIKVGINAFKLPATTKVLNPGKTYRWSVAMICDPNRPSTNVIAHSWIERVAAPTDLTQKITAIGQGPAAEIARKRAEVYAQAGLWYDAITELYEVQLKNPQNTLVREDFLSLLEQAGLKKIAAQARK